MNNDYEYRKLKSWEKAAQERKSREHFIGDLLVIAGFSAVVTILIVLVVG